ncbi:hypothetical protein Esti_005775 [Eimeria stiedai]
MGYRKSRGKRFVRVLTPPCDGSRRLDNGNETLEDERGLQRVRREASRFCPVQGAPQYEPVQRALQYCSVQEATQFNPIQGAPQYVPVQEPPSGPAQEAPQRVPVQEAPQYVPVQKAPQYCPVQGASHYDPVQGVPQDGSVQDVPQDGSVQEVPQYDPVQRAPQYCPVRGAPQFGSDQGAPQHGPVEGAPGYGSVQGAPQCGPIQEAQGVESDQEAYAPLAHQVHLGSSVHLSPRPMHTWIGLEGNPFGATPSTAAGVSTTADKVAPGTSSGATMQLPGRMPFPQCLRPFSLSLKAHAAYHYPCRRTAPSAHSDSAPVAPETHQATARLMSPLLLGSVEASVWGVSSGLMTNSGLYGLIAGQYGEVQQRASACGLTVDAAAAAGSGPQPKNSAQTVFEMAREGWAIAEQPREGDEDALDAEDLLRRISALLHWSNAFDEEEGQ